MRVMCGYGMDLLGGELIINESDPLMRNRAPLTLVSLRSKLQRKWPVGDLVA